MAAFNRSTEDLRVKQQPGSYGRLRECWLLSAGSWSLVWRGVSMFATKVKAQNFPLTLDVKLS